MSDTVRNIITVLIVVVVCVVVGALIINTVAPKAISAVVGGLEAGITNATGINVDLDGVDNAGDSVADRTTDAGADAANNGNGNFNDGGTAGGYNGFGGTSGS